MLHISSRDNGLYKDLKRLVQGRAGRHSRTGADDTNHDTQASAVADAGATDKLASGRISVVLEGTHLCQDWLQHCGQPVRAVFDTERVQDSDELQSLLQYIDASRVVSMDPALLGSLSPVARAQGVMFLVQHQMPDMPVRIDHSCIWLDRIQDPGNVGTLLRTAAAAGIAHAYLSKECASAWSPRVLRSAQGAHFVMNLYEHVDLLQARQRLDIALCTTAISEKAVSLYECTIPMPCAWVFGNEGQGVEPLLLQSADLCVYIPQESVVESLNVGVAAGICLFEQRRQQLSGT